MKKREICAIILARAGSRRLTSKNIINLYGSPLIAYTIRAARKSKYINRIICSTDSIAIASIAQKYGAEIPYIRPKKLALNKTTSIDSLIHVLNYLEKKQNYYPDIVVLLQPTSPLRTERHIDQAIELFYSKQPKSLVSVKKIKEYIYCLRVIVDGKLRSVGRKFPGKISDVGDYYCANGAIYIATQEIIQGLKTFWTNDTIPYIMDDVASIDIDTEFDLRTAEVFLNNRYLCNRKGLT